MNHDKHRQRMREKFWKEGPDAFHKHEILEMLLYYAIPRKNTNEEAHDLINLVGSFSGVFEAPASTLKKVKGIGNSSAMLLKLIPAVARIYMEDKNFDTSKVVTEDNAGEILKDKFIGRVNEVVVLMLLDSKNKMVFCGVVSEGSMNSADIYIRDIIRMCVEYNATSAIIAHNHPSGMALPSKNDLQTTVRLVDAMEMVNVSLIDHYIFADGDYVSIAQSGLGYNIFGEGRKMTDLH